LPCSLFLVWLELDFSSVRSHIVFDGGMWGTLVAAAALVEGLFAVCICPCGGCALERDFVDARPISKSVEGLVVINPCRGQGNLLIRWLFANPN
jgi:hypothetical protein